MNERSVNVAECNNCWFYCHLDGKCYLDGKYYEDPRSHYDAEYAVKVNPDGLCCFWSPDGLTQEERDALLAVELDA